MPIFLITHQGIPITVKIHYHLFLAAGLALAGASALASEPEANTVVVSAARDPEWSSYRDAYDTMQAFERYDRPKNLVEVYYALLRRDATVTLDNLKLSLIGPKTHLDIPVDRYGRAVMPKLDEAYRDNAQLIANRARGALTLKNVIQIKEAPDGTYRVQDLKEACEQARNTLIYLRRLSPAGIAMRFKKCVGITFIGLPEQQDMPVYFVDANGEKKILPPTTMGFFQGSLLRFDHWPADGQIITEQRNMAVNMMAE